MSKEIFYANEKTFFRVQFNGGSNVSGNSQQYKLDYGCRMNFAVHFNNFYYNKRITSMRLRVKLTSSGASLQFNGEQSLSTNYGDYKNTYMSDSNGYIEFDILNYCYSTQTGSNYFSLYSLGSYVIYKDTASISDYKPQLIVEYVENSNTGNSGSGSSGSSGNTGSDNMNNNDDTCCGGGNTGSGDDLEDDFEDEVEEDTTPDVDLDGFYIDDKEALINQKTIEGNAGRALGYSVNVRTGKVKYYKSLLSIPTTVMPIDLGLYYDPQLENNLSLYMPEKWRFNYNQKIMSNGEGYEYIDGTGTHHQFKASDNDSNVFFDVAGTGLILTKETTKFIIEDGYDNKLVFNSLGYLYRVISTLNGNEYGIEIEYQIEDNISIISEYIKLSSDTNPTINSKITITYNCGDILISSQGFQSITLSKSNYALKTIKEEDNRESTYTYKNGMLRSACTDNGEKVIFIYNGEKRVKTITNCITDVENTVSKLKFNYQYYSTNIVNNFGVKTVYNFNPKGELIAQYEDDNGNIFDAQYIKITEDLKEITTLSNEAYVGYSNVSLSGNTDITKDKDDTLSKGNVEFKIDNFYALMFTYSYQGEVLEDTLSYVAVLQGGVELARFELSCLCCSEQIGGVTFKVNDKAALKVKVVHGNSSAQLNVKNIKISQTNLVRVESVSDWTMGDVPYWYDISDELWGPILAKGYKKGNDSYERKVTLEDIIETQKNAAKNPSSYNVWYNNKRGLITNVSNIKVWGQDNSSYDLLSKCYGVINKTNDILKLEYNEYKTDVNLDNYICTVYNKVNINGNKKKLKETYVNKNLQPIEAYDYSNGNNVLVCEYEFDSYGNLILERCENRTDGLYTQKEYEYNKRILSKEIVKEAGNTLTTTYQTNQYTGNIEKVTLPNGCVIEYSYLENTNGKLSEISSTVNDVENTNGFSYNKDKISGYNANRYGYYVGYDKYNMVSQLMNASHFIWTTNRTINTDTIVENTCLGYASYYIDNTYDKYGNLVITKEGPSNDNLEVVREVYYSDLDVDMITTNNPMDSSLNKNKSSKLRKVVDKILNNTTEYRYDTKGNIDNIKNSAKTYKPSTTSFVFDQNNKLTNKINELENGTTFVEVDNFVFKDNSYKDELKSRIMYSDSSGEKEFVCALTENKDIVGRIDTQTFKINNSIDIGRQYIYKDENYNLSGLIKRLDLDVNNDTVERLYYEYDIMGRITHEYSSSNMIDNTYTYDLLGRLIREDNKALNKTTIINYDLGGNILNKQVGTYVLNSSPAPSTNYSYEYDPYHADYLSKYNGQTVTTSNIGNVEKIGSVTYSWDRCRFLSQVKKTSYDYVDMLYDVDGIRYKKTYYYDDTTIVHNYICEGTKILSEEIIGGSHAGTLNYLYIGNQIIGFTYKNKQYYYQKNLQGDIIRIYDTSNNVVAHYEYDAWGNHSIILDTDSIGTLNPFRYRGYYYDRETQLYWVSSRYYSPELCRWISPDSIEYLDPQSINGLNLYAYCNNDPINYIDPDGHAPKWWQTILIGVGIIAGAAFFAAAMVYTGGVAGYFIAAGQAALGGLKIAAVAGATAGIVRAGKTAIDGGDIGDVGKSLVLGFSDGFLAGSIYAGIGMISAGISYKIVGTLDYGNGLGCGWKEFNSAGQLLRQGMYQTPNVGGIVFVANQFGLNGGRSFSIDLDVRHGFHFHYKLGEKVNNPFLKKILGNVKRHRWVFAPIMIGVGVGLSDGWSEW